LILIALKAETLGYVLGGVYI